MAKLMNDVKITVENKTEKFLFNAEQVGISSSDGGFTHNLAVGKLFDAQKLPAGTPEPVNASIEAPTTAESGLTDEQKAGLKVILICSKAIERTQFVSARAIERAAHDAEQAKAVVQHDFNMAVLEALHTGLTQEQIEAHLFDAGFNQLEEKVDAVHILDTELLYQTEA